MGNGGVESISWKTLGGISNFLRAIRERKSKNFGNKWLASLVRIEQKFDEGKNRSLPIFSHEIPIIPFCKCGKIEKGTSLHAGEKGVCVLRV